MRPFFDASGNTFLFPPRAPTSHAKVNCAVKTGTQLIKAAELQGDAHDQDFALSDKKIIQELGKHEDLQ